MSALTVAAPGLPSSASVSRRCFASENIAISEDEKNADSPSRTTRSPRPTHVTRAREISTPNTMAAKTAALGDPISKPSLSGEPAKGFAMSAAGSGGLSRARSLPPAMADEPPITLYRLQACPFCERVVRKLDELGLEYGSRFVEPLHSRRNAVAAITNKRTVPAIVDRETGVTMSESANIVDYLEATYGGA